MREDVGVGDVVMFKISGEGEPLCERPMLVIACGDSWAGLGEDAAPKIDGRLFLSWEKDKRSWWVHHCAKAVTPDGAITVVDVEAGAAAGQYRVRSLGMLGGS